MQTRLNGESPYYAKHQQIIKLTDEDFEDDFVEDNSVLTTDLEEISLKKLPGVYMIRCIKNGFQYYGQTVNVSSRIAGHKYRLRHQIHWILALQDDWNTFGEEAFQFVPLFMGNEWTNIKNRELEEAQFIAKNIENCYNTFESYSKRKGVLNPFYNKKHSDQSKQSMSLSKKGRPNDKLGQKVCIQGKTYPSIAEAARQLKIARKTIRARIKNEKFSDWQKLIENE